ncbi:SEC12-like protein 2 [Rutidosis leptorrhynchoides]|uniref:SEC12-like protein 2 n=1 Tax=Rutidosis leptorrhynchoides TaxID=125765 RepID=UPI003A9A02BC
MEADARNMQKYGVPFYGAAWVPYKYVRSKLKDKDHEESKSAAAADDDSTGIEQPPSDDSHKHYVVLTGGGGEGRSGIPNAVLLAHFDFASNSLSNEAVTKLVTHSDMPYRMAVHPSGDGIVCAMQQSCRTFEWDEVKTDETSKLGLKASENALEGLEDVGQQLALAFNSEGSVLAVGGEDGNLRVFKWPSMQTIFNEAEAYTCVKDLHFSPDGKYLVSLGSGGPGRVWDIESSKVVASLSKQSDEIFASCRFSQMNDSQVLYIAARTDRGTSILTWNTTSWKRIRSKHVARDPVCSFNVSADGKFLAIGTYESQGDVLVLKATNMQVLMRIRKAHLGIVTALMFSDDSRALVSVSMDSSARVTLIEDKKKSGSSLLIIILIVLLAIAVYYLKNQGVLVL